MATKKKKKTTTKQATLFNLGGVINIREFKAQKVRLEDPDVSHEDKITILGLWSKKKPSTDDIIGTGIGKTVKRLARQPESSRLRKEAERVYSLWRKEVEKREALKERGSLEVQCDLDTQHWRNKAKRLLREVAAKAAQASTATEAVIEAIERELFNFCEHLIQSRYRCSVRKIVFALKRSADLRSAVFLDLSLSPRQLVLDHHA